MVRFLLILGLTVCYCQDELPTLYEYYTADGITSGLSVDQPYFTLNGKNITIYSGGMHYFRIPNTYWQDRLKKVRAAGLNTVETYIAWNVHEPQKGNFEFGHSGTDLERLAALEDFLMLAQQEDLFVIVRPGPFICAEFEFGGFPSWLLREEGIKTRTNDEKFMRHVEDYFNVLLPLLAKYQFTNGGPIIALQVENEYAYSVSIDLDYIQRLYDLHRSNGIVELLFTSDGAGNTGGTIPGLLFMTVNFGSDANANFGKLEENQPGQPLMAMEFYPGWFDHWSEGHHTVADSTFQTNYEQVLAYPGSVNLYMFHGGTNFGFLNGANSGPDNNAGFQPTTTSYDYDAPLTESGNYTSKYYILKDLLERYNPIKTKIPEMPDPLPIQVYDSIPVTEKLSFNRIIEENSVFVMSPETISMEEFPINDMNGQSYGYASYRIANLDVPSNSVLTITGYISDTIMVLINGKLVSKILTSIDDFNGFGYWKLENSSLLLTDTDLTNVTLDLVIENLGRVNFQYLDNQYKGLTATNKVYLNEDELQNWVINPLQFTKSWISNLVWDSLDDSVEGPALYRAVLNLDTATTFNDTYIDMREWNKGVVIINGFLLGRYMFLGPQQTLYLPGCFLQNGENEILIFEQFNAPPEIKFSPEPIFANP